MGFNIQEKNLILKTFTTHIKQIKGRGPRNIYVKYLDKEIHVVVQGMLCDFEQYAIKHFREDAVSALRKFYLMNCVHTEKDLSNHMTTYSFKVDELESDFDKDQFVYKMRYDKI